MQVSETGFLIDGGLRDAGYHWAYIFIPLIPFVGIFILIFLLCQPTEVEVPLNNVDNPQQ